MANGSHLVEVDSKTACNSGRGLNTKIRQHNQDVQQVDRGLNPMYAQKVIESEVINISDL